MAQVHIRLDDDEKEAWHEYAESEGYGSLSRFIRTAVANERDDEDYTGSAEAAATVPDDVASSNDIDQINDTLLKIVDRLEDVENRLEQVQQESIEPDDERAVIEALPQGRPSGDELTAGYVKDRDPDHEHPNAGTAVDGTAESVAVVTDEQVSSVEYYLNKMVQRTDVIESEEIDGRRRYWKTEGEGE